MHDAHADHPFYESSQALHEYLLFHYGKASDVLPYPQGPIQALNFPCRCVGETLMRVGHAGAALDLGCAVGRSSFELSKFCDSVLGIDFSASFIAAAEEIRDAGEKPYHRLEEGHRTTPMVARLPASANPGRVRFEVGDAMALREDLGSFDIVLAANLICRLPDPTVLLGRLPGLVNPGGHLALTTPCTWLGEFTPPDHWPDKATIEWLDDHLGDHFERLDTRDLPFLIRETARKFQWTVAQASLWRRR